MSPSVTSDCSNCGRVLEVLVAPNFCPYCGTPTQSWISSVGEALRRLHIDRSLPKAFRLILKVEFTEAASSALIQFEDVLRRKTGLDSHGVDLVSKSFSFDYDSKQKTIGRPPLILFGDLTTETGRNEQEGMMHLAFGVVKGWRNPLAHTPTDLHAARAVAIVTMVNFLLERVAEEGSILTYPTVTMARKLVDAEVPGVSVNAAEAQRVNVLLAQVRSSLQTHEFEGVLAATSNSEPISRSLEAVQFLLNREITELVTHARETHGVYSLTPVGKRLRTSYFEER